jgi:hypothetical protein
VWFCAILLIISVSNDVGIVRSRTKAMEFSFLVLMMLVHLQYKIGLIRDFSRMLKVAHYGRFHTLEVIKLEYKCDFCIFSMLLFFLE